MAPIVDGIEDYYEGQISVNRINALEDDGPQIMRQYRIPGHPTIVIFDNNGQETQRLIGLQSAETIEAALQQLLGKE